MGDYGWPNGVKFGSGIAKALVVRIVIRGGEPSDELDYEAIAEETEFTVSEVRGAVLHLVVHGFARIDGNTLYVLTPSFLAWEAEEAERAEAKERMRVEKIAARGGQVSRKAIPAAIREFVFDRDGRACLRCGSTEQLALDHIHPWSLGGPDTIENLQTLCRSCNSGKGDRT